MSYYSQDSIASDPHMQHRIAQAAAEQGVGVDPWPVDPFTGRPLDPDRWTIENRRQWAAAPGWDEAWDYSLLTHEDDPDYEPGKDEAVITDGQILAQVQSMLVQPEMAQVESPKSKKEEPAEA